ncbi:hypothetical protein [Aurantiacibacter zhengii]|jgi:hypothetical protein|uniref:Uncharacterized protein n=1 Tax=Aurantiacibacter zhengii TaxID=2307003 RepID=A0A418NP78_9SPHN|nr:hypothetical protein [Aurantiacibacter zhengii]RIV84175.1 hypothetical protein D2V07_14250 [Aurantiacibacter zhengii]
MLDLDLPNTATTAELRGARHAAFAALGRLEGAMNGLAPEARGIFAARLVTECVIDALRVERHAFTDNRFAAWRAGVVTLSDEATNRQRSPVRIANAVVGELVAHEWQPLAEAAEAFGLLARPLRRGPGFADETDPVEDLWQASQLASEVTASADGSDLALGYADLARRHTVFAPRETQIRTFDDGVFRRAYEMAPTVPPTWSLGFYAGTVLKAEGLLRHAIPLPGAIVAHALRPDVDEAERHFAHYEAVERAARRLANSAEEVRVADAVIRERSSSLRSNSRAPLLARHLAGFGALRSDQIDRVLGVSRVGVHGMIVSLRQLGLVATTTVSGIKLHSFRTNKSAGEHVRSAQATPWAGLSKAALDEFDDAMLALEKLMPKDGS